MPNGPDVDHSPRQPGARLYECVDDCKLRNVLAAKFETGDGMHVFDWIELRRIPKTAGCLYDLPHPAAGLTSGLASEKKAATIDVALRLVREPEFRLSLLHTAPR